MAFWKSGVDGISLKPAIFFGLGLPAARQIKVTAWALVQPFPGLNFPWPVPLVTPLATAQLMALWNSWDLGMSVNSLVIFTSGLPLERYRKVTIWSRVQVFPGANYLVLMPLVMLFCTAHKTASA